MIVLDTNVLSEAIKPSPSARVMRWLAAHRLSRAFVTTITLAEMLNGVELLPAGRRRTRLHDEVDKLFSDEFPDRILPFDEQAARLFAQIVAARDEMGRPISEFDAMIAAIARSRHAAVATRNVEDFEHCGVRVVNPWAE